MSNDESQISQQIGYNEFDQLVKKVLYVCREHGQLVTGALASFVVETLYNPQTKRFYKEDGIRRQHFDELINKAMSKINNLGDPALQTITLQIKYESLILEHDYKITEMMQIQSETNTNLIDEVLKVSNSKNYDVLSLLYKRIFNFLLQRNKSIALIDDDLNAMAEGSEFGLEKEVAAAQESVIPRAVLSPFILLNNTEKVTQLTELFNLVLGIRLFNKEIGKGGVTLASLQQLIGNEGRTLPERIQERMTEEIIQSEDYSNFFYYMQEEEGITEFSEYEIYKKEMMFLRQHLVLIMNLQEKVEESENTIESNEGRYLKEISDLKNQLGSKSSAPKEQVYPKFAVLASSYLELSEERKQVTHKMQLYNVLEESFKAMKFSLPESERQKVRKWAMEREQSHPVLDFDAQPGSGVVWVEPKQNSPEYLQNPIDFFGFCIVTLVQHDGLLMPGRHEMGIFKYQDKMLLFRGAEEAKLFLQNPADLMEKFLVLCRTRPELIFLLRMEDYFRNKNLNLIHLDKTERNISSKIMIDKNVETPLHIVDRYIDHNYCWNEWELRKKAIQMANIRNMVTKATQTADSVFKIDNESQVWLPREVGTMTGIEDGSNPIRPRNYITELRDKTNQ